MNAGGRWTEIYDEDRERWVNVYIELPEPIQAGSAMGATGSDDAVVLYGPDGRRITSPRTRQIGFRR